MSRPLLRSSTLLTTPDITSAVATQHTADSAAYLTGANVPGGMTALANTLAVGAESCALQVLEDSTGIEGGGNPGTARWTSLLPAWVASRYPTYGVQKLNWNDTNQAFDAPVIAQAPPNGADYAQFGASGSVAQHPGYGLGVTTDLEVIVKYAADNWASGVAETIVSRWGGGGAGTRQFFFQKKSSNALTFAWSADGATQAFNQQIGTPTYPANGSPMWFRTRLQVNNAGQWTVTMHTSTDYDPYAKTGTWTIVGSAWTNNSGPTSVFANASNFPYEIGGSSSAASAAGKVYWVEVRDGIDGPNLVPAQPSVWSSSSADLTRGGSPMFTLVNGSKSGAALSYLTDTTRLPKIAPLSFNTLATILCCSHNDLTQRGVTYLSLWDTWLTNLRARQPNVPVTVMTQNPRTSPANYRDAHRVRSRDQIAWAAKNGLAIIDVHRAMIESGVALSTYVYASDGIHPTDSDGSPLYASLVEAALTLRS